MQLLAPVTYTKIQQHMSNDRQESETDLFISDILYTQQLWDSTPWTFTPHNFNTIWKFPRLASHPLPRSCVFILVAGIDHAPPARLL